MIKKPVSEYSCDKSVELVVGNGNILVRGENLDVYKRQPLCQKPHKK